MIPGLLRQWCRNYFKKWFATVRGIIFVVFIVYLIKIKPMAENNRNQQENVPSPGLGRDKNTDVEKENLSGKETQDENPQEGKEWSNYRTRELAGNQDQEEKSSSQSEK
jgi:flagellar biosynthesis/type III secretory pathway M-ring protein FliF/YscJ